MYEMEHLSKAWSDFFDNTKIYKQVIKNNPKTDMKRPTPPDFTKKNDQKQSFTTRLINTNIQKHGIKEDGKLTLPKITGNIKVQYHRPIIGIPKKYTISKKHGKYYVSILVEYKNDVSKKEVKSVVGIDAGVKSLIVTSENEVIKNPKYLNQHLNHLSKLISNRDKCVKYSNNWKKLNKKVHVLEEKISNCRKNYNHNVSKRLVDQYDLICMEDLDLVEMTKSNKGTVENPGTNVKQKSNLNRNILDAGLGMLREMIIYKSVSSGKHTIKVDRFFPSSKKCNNCGTVNENLLLSQRVWECKNCKSEIDRDYNAALNIRDLGKKMFFENLEN
jgi:putative transposase